MGLLTRQAGRRGVHGTIRSLAGAALVALACAPASSPPLETAFLPPPAAALAAVPAPAPVAAPVPSVESHIVRAKGWGWLVTRLAADGVDLGRAERAFADPRIPAFDGLFFSIRPRRAALAVRGGAADAEHRAGARLRVSRTRRPSTPPSARTGVPAELVASILHVETRCGRNTGNSIVLYGLARLAMANEPDNVAAEPRPPRAARGSLDAATSSSACARAPRARRPVLPRGARGVQVAERWDVEPLSLRGSRVRRVRVRPVPPHQLPAFRHGRERRRQGRSLSIEDAAASTAAYLARHGWEGELTRAARRQVIWHYNRSDAYIDAVLALSDKLHGSVRRAYAETPAPAHPATAGSVPAPAGQ